MSAADLTIQPRINSESLAQAFEQSLVAENDFSMDAAPLEAPIPAGVVLHPLLFACTSCSCQAVLFRSAPNVLAPKWRQAVVVTAVTPAYAGS